MQSSTKKKVLAESLHQKFKAEAVLHPEQALWLQSRQEGKKQTRKVTFTQREQSRTTQKRSLPCCETFSSSWALVLFQRTILLTDRSFIAQWFIKTSNFVTDRSLVLVKYKVSVKLYKIQVASIDYMVLGGFDDKYWKLKCLACDHSMRQCTSETLEETRVSWVVSQKPNLTRLLKSLCLFSF